MMKRTTKLTVIRQPTDLSELTRSWQIAGAQIGLVPTMGALHEGHLSLVRAARGLVDRLVVSIFINPAQFSPQEDLEKYPRTLQEDLQSLEPLGVDVVFVPDAIDLYPAGFSTYVDPPEVARGWEGAVRPTHFRGVTTIVLKLLHLARADQTFFGQKDYQQSVVVQRMIADLNLPCRLHVLPTIREPDGLAMSSRNRYLSPGERAIATSIYRTLCAAREAIEQGERDGQALASEMTQALIDAGFDGVDYAAVCDPERLTQLDRIVLPAVLLVAARVGSTRLIDNWLMESP